MQSPQTSQHISLLGHASWASSVADDAPTTYILIVDDDPDAQELMQDVVSAIGLDTRCASDGHEALDIVRNQVPVLVLLDLMMPNLDGFSFFSRMRAVPATRHVPVIVVTAIEPEQVDMLRLPGVTEVVQKGQLSIQEFVSLLDKTLARNGRI